MEDPFNIADHALFPTFFLTSSAIFHLDRANNSSRSDVFPGPMQDAETPSNSTDTTVA
jgi:hypothetical protein